MSAIMNIRETGKDDLDRIMEIHRRAFGQEEEARLTADLLVDETARPRLSLLAESDVGAPLGHILFSRAGLAGEESPAPLFLLCPLGVVPEVQGQGVGGELIRCGLELLADGGAGLVFVLGHPAYYRRFGFTPAGRQGLDAPYPIPPQHADAWMVQALSPGLVGRLKGRVSCADCLMQPPYWRQ